MKKYFIFAASALALASCSSDDFTGEGQGNIKGTGASINFSSETGALTRAAQLNGGDAASALENNFVVVGFKGSATAAANNENIVFDHYNVNYGANTAGSTNSNTKDWEYVGQSLNVKGIDPAGQLADANVKEQTIKYWDYSAASYDFVAFSMGKGAGQGDAKKYAKPSAVDKANLATAAYTLEGTADQLAECYISDMKTVEKKDYKNVAVPMTFRHLSSKVRIALYETVPGYVISDVKFYDAHDAADATTTPALIGKFNKDGKATVFFPTTGTDNKDVATHPDYNKAHVKFEATTTDAKMEFTAVAYGNQKENAIEAGNQYLSQTASTPSYCGDFKTVIPAEDKSEEATLFIDYTLTASDGSGEVIHVKKASAVVPAAYTAWKPGYAYTYIFKISQDTNGSTGDPTKPEEKGLTAISFDAVVAADEVEGQQTITTVADPSITTYGFKDGKVAMGDEYDEGTDIFATVHVPAVAATNEGESVTPATTVAPQKLYTVVLEDGAAQTINEASVKNAIANGGKTDVNGKKLTVTETTDGVSKVTTVPTADNHGLKVNAIKWTGKANTIYAVEYTKGETKAYKIVRVK